MRVWLLQRSEPTPHDNNGGQRLMRTGIMAQVLIENGCDVLWWSSTFDHYNRRQRYESDTRVPVNDAFEVQYLRGCGYNRNVSFDRLRENLLIANRFTDLVAQETSPPDIIVASLPTAELALAATSYAKERSVPTLIDVRDLWPDVFLDLVPRSYRQAVRFFSLPMKRIVRKACRNATGIIGLTEAFVDWGVAHAGRTRGRFDRVFPMGYMQRTNDFSPQELEDAKRFWKELGVNKERYRMIVVFFGALGRTNDLGPVIQSARILRQNGVPVLFVICGAGESEDALRREGGDLDNLVLPGWVNAAQIRTLLDVADIGVAPYIASANYIHNIPNKPGEYLSGGLGIALSLDHGALYDLVMQRGCGFSYSNSADALAYQLESMIDEPARLSCLKMNARTTFRDMFDGTVVYSELVRFLETTVTEFSVARKP